MKHLTFVLFYLLFANFAQAEENCSGKLKAGQEVVEVASKTSITAEKFTFTFSSGEVVVNSGSISGGQEAFSYHLQEADKSVEPATGVILRNEITGARTLALVTTIPRENSDDSDICVADGLFTI